MNNILLLISICLCLTCCAAHTHSLHVPLITQYDDGTLKSEYIYVGGEFPELERIYRQDGTLASVIQFRNKKIHGFKNTYYRGGKTWMKELYSNGILMETIEYDENGSIIFELQNY